MRAGLAVAVLAALALPGLYYVASRSDRAWGVGEPRPQPIPFRHDLHVGGLGLDCRYCHASVELAAEAGMPSALTCMTCHRQVWSGADVLEPLRTSLVLGTPIPWSRLHALPDGTHFHHGIHVSNGIPCATCHGQVQAMAETIKTEPMSMEWCLECHRSRASGAVPDAAPGRPGPVDVATERLTNCDTCHY